MKKRHLWKEAKIILVLFVLCIIAFLILELVTLKKVYQSDVYDARETMKFDLDLSSNNYLLSKEIKDDNYIMYAEKIDEKIYPASITKLMTLVVALDYIDDPNERIVATYDDMAGLLEANASILGVWNGTEISLKTAIYGLLLPSGADCANILRRYTEEKSNQDFIDLMNQKARELDMDDTHYANVTGLFDEENYTTLRDLNKLMIHILNDSRAFDYVTTWEVSQDGFDMEATMNPYRDLLKNDHAEVLGGKTGFIGESGLNYACFIKNDQGEIYILITAGASEESTDIPNHAKDVNLIIDTYFDGV